MADANKERPNPYDPARFKVNTASTGAIAVKVLTRIPVGKPQKQRFVRVHPGDAFRLECAIFNLSGADRPYLVDPNVAHQLGTDLKHVSLRLAMDAQGNSFLWPVPLSTPEERENLWNSTHRDIAQRAETCWLRLVSDRASGCYYAMEAASISAVPDWPSYSLPELLELAFGGGHVIDRDDHPALKALRGEL
jgi:hypothetical protein